MMTVLWGLLVGLLYSSGLALLPVLLVALSGSGFEEFDFVGGVVGYIAWAYLVGILGGLTAGFARLYLRSERGMRLAAGLVGVEAFGTQVLLFWDRETVGELRPFDVALVLGVPLLLGVVFGPMLVRAFYKQWPALHDWGAPRGKPPVRFE